MELSIPCRGSLPRRASQTTHDDQLLRPPWRLNRHLRESRGMAVDRALCQLGILPILSRNTRSSIIWRLALLACPLSSGRSRRLCRILACYRYRRSVDLLSWTIRVSPPSGKLCSHQLMPLCTVKESYWNSKRVYARNRHLHQCALQSSDTQQKAASRYNSHLERHRMYSKNWAEKTRPYGGSSGKRKSSFSTMGADEEGDFDMDLEEQDGASSEYEA